jgi:hypothetical protein
MEGLGLNSLEELDVVACNDIDVVLLEEVLLELGRRTVSARMQDNG